MMPILLGRVRLPLRGGSMVIKTESKPDIAAQPCRRFEKMFYQPPIPRWPKTPARPVSASSAIRAWHHLPM